MTILFVCGLVSLVFGLMFLFSPEKITKISNSASKIVLKVDEKIIKIRVGLGICMIALGIVCFFLIYYVVKKY